MEPLKPLARMKPMEPRDFGQPWWPAELGEPSTCGSQDGARYAYFARSWRLLIQEGGQLSTYDTGQHEISGVVQAQSHGRSLTFTSQDGPVSLEALTRL